MRSDFGYVSDLTIQGIHKREETAVIKRSLEIAALLGAPLLSGELAADFISNFEISGAFNTQYMGSMTTGPTIGDQTTVFDFNKRSVGEPFSWINQLRIFANGDIGEKNSFHFEGNLIGDPFGVNNEYTWYNRFTEFDWFRELYLDTNYDDAGKFTSRIGKQQVVWGTADGIKLLDIINPTDFRFLNQEPFEESRIAIWMAVGEYNPTDNTNLQAIVAQSQESFIPGLRASGDTGQPFIMKGVDTITGISNGFLNITPNLGSTARAFQEFVPAFTGGAAGTLSAVGGNTFTVQDFVNGNSPFCPGGTPAIPGLGNNCQNMLNTIAQSPDQSVFGTQLGGNENITNLVTDSSIRPFNGGDPAFTFEYMNEASFSTFDTFARANSVYVTDMDTEPNVGFRWKQTTGGGINYSLNYFWALNSNPSVEIFWQDKQGQTLNSVQSQATNQAGQTVTTVSLQKQDGTPFVPTDSLGNVNDGTATLVFRQFTDRVHNIGGSFDSALDLGKIDTPIVLRGELLYQKDVLVPVIDRSQLAVGDVTKALRPEDADFLKYVLGVDVTVMTNLLVSGQLIQFWNLDYIDEQTDTVNGGACTVANCGRYTGDPTTLSLTNGMKRGDRVETFGSLFLSKPFGAEQQHRWNNIFIVENDWGFWNRFDVEYTFTGISENLLGTVAANFYFGDDNTTFGQMEKSSNFIVGLEYLFGPRSF